MVSLSFFIILFDGGLCMKTIRISDVVISAVSFLFLAFLGFYFSPGIISLVFVGPRKDDVSVSQMAEVWTFDILYWLLFLASVLLIVFLFIALFKKDEADACYKKLKTAIRMSQILLGLSIVATVVFSIVSQTVFSMIMLLSSVVPLITLLFCLYVKHKIMKEEKEGII